MDFDKILEELGEIGKFQIITLTLICLPVLFAGANTLIFVFTAGIPQYRCLVPSCDGKTSKYNESWLKWAIPNDAIDGRKSGGYSAAQCQRFVQNFSINNSASCFKNSFTNQTESCQEWIFDSNERTIVNEWNITCLENQWKLSLVGTVIYAGIFVGCIVFGVLADKYGRKLIFLICTIIMCVAGVVQAFSPNYVTYITFTFINAIGVAQIYPLAFIIGMEMVGTKRREFISMTLNYVYALGEAMLALIAWLFRDWFWIQIVVCAPSILFVLFYNYIPESVRWLLVKEKTEKAKAVVCKVAKVNNVKLSQPLLETSDYKTSNTTNSDIKEDRTVLETLKAIIASRKLVIRSFVLCFTWGAIAFTYGGLSLNSGSLGGDKYINFALVCLAEIPGNTIAWLCLSKFGRRISFIGSLFVCGITCGASAFIPNTANWTKMLLFLIGKMGVTSAYSIAFVYTAEMLPTSMRSAGIGVTSTVSTACTMLAPFVPLLDAYYPHSSLLIFSCLSIVSAITAFKLPETLGIKLPNTLEEAERI